MLVCKDLDWFQGSLITKLPIFSKHCVFIRVLMSWNNGKEVPRWGVAEIQKMSPSTAAAVLSNKGVGTADQSDGLIIFAVRVWSAVVYLLSRHGRTCEL